jgi:restriction system protein
MANPKEIGLTKINVDNNIIRLEVQKLDFNCLYRWQECKANSSDWTDCSFARNDRDYLIVSSNNIQLGKRFRCLLEKNGRVLFYTNSYVCLSIEHERACYQESQNDDFENTYDTEQENTNGKRYDYHCVEETDGMDGFEFEQYCADILRKNGFYDVSVTQSSGDFGIDILAKKDYVSYGIQCKCYAEKVGNKAVQEAYSGKSYYHCVIAVVLTNSYFTKSAYEIADANSVLLWNRDELSRMIDNAYSRRKKQSDVIDDSNERILDFDFFKGCNTKDDIKQRYKDLMKVYHPDKKTGDEQIAKYINDQYEKKLLDL